MEEEKKILFPNVSLQKKVLHPHFLYYQAEQHSANPYCTAELLLKMFTVQNKMYLLAHFSVENDVLSEICYSSFVWLLGRFLGCLSNLLLKLTRYFLQTKSTFKYFEAWDYCVFSHLNLQGNSKKKTDNTLLLQKGLIQIIPVSHKDLHLHNCRGLKAK